MEVHYWNTPSAYPTPPALRMSWLHVMDVGKVKSILPGCHSVGCGMELCRFMFYVSDGVSVNIRGITLMNVLTPS